jgi:hypothetical protein
MNRSRRKPGHACIAELDLLTLFSPAAQFTPIPCCRINIVSKTVFDYLVLFEVFPLVIATCDNGSAIAIFVFVFPAFKFVILPFPI